MGTTFTTVELLNTDEIWQIEDTKMVSIQLSKDNIFDVKAYHQDNFDNYKRKLIKTPVWKNQKWIKIKRNELKLHPFVPFLPVGSQMTEMIWLIAESNGKTYNITKLVKEKPKNFIVIEEKKSSLSF